jgi:hypothetical protein
VKRTEATRTNGKAHATVAAAPQKPLESKERSYPLPTHVRPNIGPDASDELTMDTALKQPDDDGKRASLERKKSKKMKKSSRKKSHRHLREDDENSIEDSDARRERHRRKKEKKAAKKKARETAERSHDEKSRKKKHKKHKKHSKSDSQILTDGHAPHVHDNKSMPEMKAKDNAALENYVRARESKEPTKSSSKSVPERSLDPRSSLDDYIRDPPLRKSSLSLQSDGHTTVKKSNVHSSGNALKSLSDSARSRQHRSERRSIEPGLSDSARSRKARTERDAEMSDSHKFRKALQASRKAAADAKNDTLRPLSPRKESPDKNTSSTIGTSLLPTGIPQQGPTKKLPSQSTDEINPYMESIGKFDMLEVVDAAGKTKKVGTRTSGGETRTTGTKPSAPTAAASGGPKKKKSRNMFKSLLLFSRKSESDVEGAEESRQKRRLFGGSKAKKKSHRARSAPPRVVDRGAQHELNAYLNNSKTDSKSSWNDSIEEENKLLRSPAKPALDLPDFNRVLGAPPGEKLGTAPLSHRDYSGRRRRRKSPQGESY